MPKMTDPSDALESFQGALKIHSIALQRCELDRDLYVHLDHPNGQSRFTYVRLEGRTVKALVMFVITEPIDGIPCFHVGYAVPEPCRNQGLAKNAVTAAISELKNDFARSGVTSFYIEAVVGTDNEPSQHVATRTLTVKPVSITDELSGLPAYQYLCRI